jgi:CheY-like chemotaxis protein
MVMGSAPHLNKVLLNLCMNAVDSMTGHGQITITTEINAVVFPMSIGQPMPPGSVLLRVKDSGCGIAQENIPRIFEPFFSTKKGVGKGSGFGLSVVLGAVQDLGGSIDVKSAVGVGSEFIIGLSTPPSTEKAIEVSVNEPIRGGKESILVIDDDLALSRLALRILRDKGYTADSVAGGLEGIEFVKKHPVDLVILDMIMDPGLDGLDTYRQLHADHPHIACIIASGFSESSRVREARALGAQAFIAKPYTANDLLRKVRSVLDETVLIREAERIVRNPSTGPT